MTAPDSQANDRWLATVRGSAAGLVDGFLGEAAVCFEWYVCTVTVKGGGMLAAPPGGSDKAKPSRRFNTGDSNPGGRRIVFPST